LVQPLLEAVAGQRLGDVDAERVHADGEGDDEEEDENRSQHHRTSTTPSNMCAGRLIPAAFRRSAHLGRTPVARNRPISLFSGEMPAFSNAKISCMVMTAPSMPVISDTLVTLRVPSLSRVCCTTSCTA